jgi:hypothetical protein
MLPAIRHTGLVAGGGVLYRSRLDSGQICLSRRENDGVDPLEEFAAMSTKRFHSVALIVSCIIVALGGASVAEGMEVCSAWAEPARVKSAIELRKRQRMRADESWVVQVACDPEATPGYNGILMTPAERREFDDRFSKMSEDAMRHATFGQTVQAYGKKHPQHFAGAYFRRASDDLLDPPAALVVRFTGDLSVHEKALKSLLRVDLPIEVLPAKFSMQQLEELTVALRGKYGLQLNGGPIKFLSWGPDVINNVVKVDAESNLPDAAAQIEAGHGGMVKAAIHPAVDDSPRASVQQGAGWRFLGSAEIKGGFEDQGTKSATNDSEWQELQASYRNLLPQPARRVDFSKEIALTFTESLSCVKWHLEGISIDRQLQSIEPRISAPGADRMCRSIYTGYEVFAVAIERAALPANPITVPVGPGNRGTLPRGLTIPPYRP